MSAEVPENALEKIQALREELKEYCSFQMHIRYLFEADALQLELYLRRKEDKEKVEKIVQRYEGLLRVSEKALQFQHQSSPTV